MSRRLGTGIAVLAFAFVFTNCANKQSGTVSLSDKGGSVPSGSSNPWGSLPTGSGVDPNDPSATDKGTTTASANLDPSDLAPGVSVDNKNGQTISNPVNGQNAIHITAAGPQRVSSLSPGPLSSFALPPPWVPSRTVLRDGGLYDFGGMYGWYWNGSGHAYYPNPVTNAPSCPLGYQGATILGTENLDYPVVFCFRPHVDGVEADYDFGGIFGWRWDATINNHAPYNNPATDATSCPATYSEGTALGTPYLDYAVKFCYRRHQPGVDGLFKFGGAYGYYWNKTLKNHMPYLNPATNGANCPDNYLPSIALGTAYLDYPIVWCYQRFQD